MMVNSEETKEENTQRSKINTSMLLSFVAVVVSCLTMFISIIETNIMKEQQEIMREQQDLLASQKAASVWPYLQASPSLSYQLKEGIAIYRYEIMNKGVGPAIFGDVEYMFERKDVESYGLVRELRKKYPDIQFEYRSNMQIDSLVLSAGEELTVVSFHVEEKEENMGEIQEILNDIHFSCNLCYCSIYGDCWRLEYGKSTKNEICRNRTDIN